MHEGRDHGGYGRGKGALIDRLGGDERWPQDPLAGASLDPLIEDWRKDPAAERLLATLEHPRVRTLIAGIAAGSPYLRSEFTRHPARLDDALRAEPERRFAELTSALASDLDGTDVFNEAMTALRTYKAAVAQLIALSDLAGVWDVVEVTRALSASADAALQGAVRFLFRQAVAKGEWLADPAGADLASGYIVLAVGKYGACELNYSSDIDLIIFFERAKARLKEGVEPQTFFVRLTRDLVRLMDERTAAGYVFRTDLRLRPDAGATQIAPRPTPLRSTTKASARTGSAPPSSRRAPWRATLRRAKASSPSWPFHLAPQPRLRSHRRHSRHEAADPRLPRLRRHRRGRPQHQARLGRHP